jgi:hypothetical protein
VKPTTLLLLPAPAWRDEITARMSGSPKLHRLKNWIAVIETFMVLFGLWAFVGGIICLLAPVRLQGEPIVWWLLFIPMLCVILLCVPREMLVKAKTDLIAKEGENNSAN